MTILGVGGRKKPNDAQLADNSSKKAKKATEEVTESKGSSKGSESEEKEQPN